MTENEKTRRLIIAMIVICTACLCVCKIVGPLLAKRYAQPIINIIPAEN